MLLCLLFSIFALTSGIVFAQTGPTVDTLSGTVLGNYETSVSGRPFNAFLGIPFAKPPLDELRFAPPVKNDPWSGIFEATVDPPPCYQLELIFDHAYKGQEDCLTLNVYSPKLPSNDSILLPVQVFIYGGAFVEGENTFQLYGPQKHMDYDIVLVLMNYRLGPFGFLSTYDSVVPGNAGLLDQVLALQWVRDNIAAFGGNPNDVTLSGESAGSDSTTLHMLSPVSAGLFHKAIAESGNPVTPWGIVENPRYYAELLGEKFNCSTDDSNELVACLRDQNYTDLYKMGEKVSVQELILAFAPVVENPDETRLFLWEDPHILLQEGRFNKVPLLSGFNRDEGDLIYVVAEPLGLFRKIDDVFFDVNVPLLLRILTDYRQNLINVSYAIKDLYYGDIDLENSTAVTRANIDLLSDMFMIPWVFQFNNLVAKNGLPVYTYAFNYNGQYSAANYTGESDDIHAIELIYLFNTTLGSFNVDLNERDSAFSQMFLNLWVNFVINGNPTPVGSPVIWETTPFNSTVHFFIDEECYMLPDYQNDRINFWINEVPEIVYGSS
ncbi:hypothetical protein CHUAL_001958 [Chamberlinius hualienensis]